MANRVLISGAGIGGLALANSLSKARIPFLVFERDPSPLFRAQGYRIRISPEGASALRAALTPELWTYFERSCADNGPGNNSLDALTGQAMENPLSRRNGPGGGPDGPGGPSRGGMVYTADRIVLRTLLLSGLEEGAVIFGKELRGVDVVDDGVVARFADGSTVQGNVLVGADGLRSVVRRQHFPEVQPIDTQGRCVFGKTPLTQEVLEKVHGPCLQTTSIVQERGRAAPITLYLEPIRFPRNGEEHPADYIYWALLSRTDVFSTPDDVLLKMDGEEAARFTLKITETWHPPIRALLELQEKSQTSALRIHSTVPAQLAWGKSPSRITAIGDAIHVMPPTGGVGANTALRDAAILGEFFAKDGVTVQSIGKYESAMKEYAPQAVEHSSRGGKFMFNQPSPDECKPVRF